MHNFANIPQELRERSNWLVWKYESADGKAKPTKVPFNVSGYQINPTDKANLTWFDAAVKAVEAGKFDGIGYSFQSDDPYCGIDLDDTSDEDLVKVQDKIFEQFQSYTEYSPSGKGVHIILKGAVAEGVNAHGIELYSSNRYFTFTGDICRDLPIVSGNGALTILWEEIRARQAKARVAAIELPIVTSKQSDDEVCTACEQMTGGVFGELYIAATDEQLIVLGYESRDGKGDGSAADGAMLTSLRNVTADVEQIKRIFLDSPRGKTITRKGNIATQLKYLKRTLEFVFNDYVPPMNLGNLLEVGRNFLNAKKAIRVARENALLEHARLRREEKQNEREKKAFDILRNEGVGSDETDSELYSFAPILREGEEYPLPPGFMSEVAQFIYDTSHFPSSQIALSGALSFMSLLVGRAFNIEEVGLNLYSLVLAKSSAGKSAADKAFQKIISQLDMEFPELRKQIVPSAPASSPALLISLADQPSQLLEIGEFWGHFKKITNDRSPPVVQELVATYSDTYTKSGAHGIVGGVKYADRAKEIPQTKQPNLVIFAETVPDQFYDNLSMENLTNGFLARFIVFEVEIESSVRNKKASTVKLSNRVLTGITQIMRASKYIQRIGVPTDCELSDEAYVIQDAYEAAISRSYRTKEASNVMRSIWLRNHIKALKLAALLAVVEHHSNPENQDNSPPIITAEMMRWAIMVTNETTRRFVKTLRSGKFGTGDTRAVSEAVAFLKRYVDSDASTLPKGQLRADFHARNIIGKSYWAVSVGSVTAFDKSPGGRLMCWDRVCKSLIESGVIAKLDQASMNKFGVKDAIVYQINTSILDSMD